MGKTCFYEINFFPKTKTIKVFESVAHLKENKFQDKAVAEIEEVFKVHRKLKHFSWINNPLLPYTPDTPLNGEVTLYTFDDCTSNAFFRNVPFYTRKLDISKLAICYINDQIGYGVVTTQTIKKGQWFIFNGETQERDNQVYLDDNPYIGFGVHPFTQQTYLTDCQSCGGFASLILAAIPSDFFPDIIVAGFETENLGFANLVSEVILVNGVPQHALVAINDISPYTVLFVNYGKSFFMQFKGAFAALNNDGTPTPLEITQLVNQKLEEYVLSRNTHLTLNPKLLRLLEKIDKQQLLHKESPFPRIFKNEQLFIIYPDVYKDLLELSNQMIEEQELDLVEDCLEFISAINNKYNVADKNMQLEISEEVDDLFRRLSFFSFSMD